jgi:putative endonuclease
MQGGWVYIVTNRPNGTLYIGVTSDLARRAWEHREGVAEGFTKRYGLKILVYAERHDDIRTAIQRERNLKHWSRAWKVRLILADNPDWNDLYDQLVRVRGWPGQARPWRGSEVAHPNANALCSNAGCGRGSVSSSSNRYTGTG